MHLIKFYFLVAIVVTVQCRVIHAAQETLVPPLEIKQDRTPYNQQSVRGVPVPTGIAGSDGRLVAYPGNIGASANPATGNQFSGFLSYAAVAAPASPEGLVSGMSYIANSANLGLPRGDNGSSGIVLSRASVGAPFLNRPVSFLFGGIIPLPDEGENGVKLDASVAAESYWRREPHLASGQSHVEKGYYYSPHAQTIFAIQAGPISITWRKLLPEANTPDDHSDATKWVLDGGNYYRLYPKRYIVSGSAVKEPKTIYWNTAGFDGPAVDIPTASIQDLQIVYNTSFPELVATGMPAGNNSFTSSGDENVEIVIKKTLWRDGDQLKALNATGRVFLELLGDTRADGRTRQHLGFEIVDVVKYSVPSDITIELGDRITPYNEGQGQSDEADILSPTVITVGSQANQFAFEVGRTAKGIAIYHAVGETFNLNDYQIYWMKEGIQGIKWPRIHARYRFIWPTDPARYSHYTRPHVDTIQEAEVTAVQLPLENSPVLQYQDSLDIIRGFLNENFAYYTYLTPDQPQHRALIRYTSGNNVAFERVFSWLDSHLQQGDLGRLAVSNGTLVPARHLAIWGPQDQAGLGLEFDNENLDENGQSLPIIYRSSQFLTNNLLEAPRVISDVNITVGQRIQPPDSEQGSEDGEDYLAGYIIPDSGNLYHPQAYIDPLVEGFEKASQGAIIPVNAIPNQNRLEVLWFRANKSDQGKGFLPVYWPSVKASYIFDWPTSSKEIVLASNAGSGELSSMAAKGSIYRQPVSGSVGYNPNEEHGLMIAGRAYALRDDLNIVSEDNYTSEPYVLLEYAANDGRPAMEVFHVIREKPSEGLVFDYIVEAGTMLQAPMPLPLLENPTFEENGVIKTKNKEIFGTALPDNWDSLGDAKNSITHYTGFTYEDRKQNKYVYRGRHGGPPALQAGYYNPADDSWSEEVSTSIKAGFPFTWDLHVSQIKSMVVMEFQSGSNIPDWLSIDGLRLASAIVPTSAVSDSSYDIPLVVRSLDGVSNPVAITVTITVLDPTSTFASVIQQPLNLGYENDQGLQVQLGDRAPYLAELPTGSNSLKMEFYYRNQEAFDWPHRTTPALRSIVPYLLPAGESGYLGDPTSMETSALKVVYRPVWPAGVPEMKLSETLVKPTRGLPDIGGQSSLKILYQQAVANSISTAGQIEKTAVILHDPTRAKGALLMDELPSSINQSAYNGKIYFPKLPPHLVKRFYLDPRYENRTVSPVISGQLTFEGEFREESLGQDYILLNVMSDEEVNLLKDLCHASDTNKSNWDTAIDQLATELVSFLRERDDSGKPTGRWIANDSGTSVLGYPNDLAPGIQTISNVQIAEVVSDDTAVSSYALTSVGNGTGYVTLISNDGNNPDIEGLPISLHVLRVGSELAQGELKVIYAANPLDEQVTFQHSQDLAGQFGQYQYEWFISAPVDGSPLPIPASAGGSLDAGWIPLESRRTNGMGEFLYTLGGSGIQTLSDNYITMRYRATDPTHPAANVWSAYMEPQLAEGWIKRVLAGINPFNQRITDLFNNAVNTEVSLVAQAGTRWEGNIALNLENMNDHGLIEIYETVLNRGKSLSIDSGINYGPANDALLLAAGYLNDLYVMLGNEASADAANPTIGISTSDGTYGDIATSMFAFKGQMPTLLEEELGLLRGRDDFLQPGVEISPVYNRMFWNYTRGIDSGEAIYALNYNIQEYFAGGELDGVINAEDASKMYPTGHGDAYGHYLSALKGYYRLLIDADFEWSPRTEAVTILGKPVQVDYLDERKFASAASSLATTGLQVTELTWRKDYEAGEGDGWSHWNSTRSNPNRVYTQGGESLETTRYWGVDHWANRTGIGAYVNWVVGNGMLPAFDLDPTHEGIQKIDRTTVSELSQIVLVSSELQQTMDTVEAGMTPLGVSDDSIIFDINPNLILGGGGDPVKSHYEQIHDKAVKAMSNAITAFDEAKDVTSMMRSEEDELSELRNAIELEEFAYTTKLIEIFGEPYAGDIGPGKTYPQGYVGPDLLHWSWVEGFDPIAETRTTELAKTYRINKQSLPSEGVTADTDFNMWKLPGEAEDDTLALSYVLADHGYPAKPDDLKGTRGAVGSIQTLVVAAQTQYFLLADQLDAMEKLMKLMDTNVRVFRAINDKKQDIRNAQEANLAAEHVTRSVETANEIYQSWQDYVIENLERIQDGVTLSFPTTTIAGLAAGGDFLRPAIGGVRAGFTSTLVAVDASSRIRNGIVSLLRKATDFGVDLREFHDISLREWEIEKIEQVNDLVGQLNDIELAAADITLIAGDYQDAREAVNLAAWEGARLLEEREIFRKRASAIIQGFRTRDAAFRIFRNERLERYKSLFDLAATYTFLTAKAFDYETGLLGSSDGESFVERIIASRALGIMKDGEPQFAASSTGDPGLSSILAEMASDWDVLQGRLGINNPDTYGTSVSMRTENYRIFPDESGDSNWKDVLSRSAISDLRRDADVMRYCMQVDTNDGLPVPGLILEFSTTITGGLNLFGNYLSPGDSTFSDSSFANKIFGVGVAFEGYKGINDPIANTQVVQGSGALSPGGGVSFMDPDGMSATPYIYLIPVGTDFMRTPPLGDTSGVRKWKVAHVSLPLPFNVGSSDYSAKRYWQTSDSLSEDLYTVRKHQAFRAVSTADAFDQMNISMDNYTNNRLIGRSVWNSRWKLVIPGKSLLNDPDEGLERFIRSVKDIKIHFKTYSYSGN